MENDNLIFPKSYHAFISYSHKDKAYASIIHKSIESLGLPFYKSWKSNVNIFRDERKIPLTGNLTESIINGLKESKHLIVIASKNSANSKWVREEIINWQRFNKDEKGYITNFNFILIDEVIEWDYLNHDFNKLKTTALPYFEEKIFKELPLWANIQQYCKENKIQKNNSNYEWEIAKIKGLLLNKKPDEIIDEVSQGKRLFRIITGVIISILITLSAIAFYLQNVATDERDKAIKSEENAKYQEKIAFKERDTAEKATIEAKLQKDTAVYERDEAERQKKIAINYANSLQIKNLASEIANRGLKVQNINPSIALRLLEKSHQLEKDPGVLQNMNKLYSTGSFYRKKISFNENIKSFKLVNNQGDILIAVGTNISLIDDKGQVLKTWIKHKKNIVDLDIAPDSSFFVSIGEDSLMIKWNFDDLFPKKIKVISERKINAVKISNKNDIGISVSSRRTYIYSAELVQKKILKTNQGNINSLAFSPDGNRIITSSTTGFNENNRYFFAKVWDISYEGDTAKEIMTLPHNDMVLSVEYDPMGKYLLTGGGDGKVKIWDASTGNFLLELLASNNIITGRDATYVNYVTFSPDGQNILSSCNDNSIFLWNREGMFQKSLINYQGTINDIKIAFSKTSNQILTNSQNDKGLVYWDNYDRQISSFEGRAFYSELSYSAKFALAGGSFSDILLYNTASNKVAKRFPDKSYYFGFIGDDYFFLRGIDTTYLYNAISESYKTDIPDIKLLAPGRQSSVAIVLSKNGTLSYIDLIKNQNIKLFNPKDHQEISCIYFDEIKKIIIIGRDNGTIEWTSLNGELLEEGKDLHNNSIISLSMGKNGEMISASNDDIITYWSGKNKPISSFSIPKLYSAQLSPNSDIIIAKTSNEIYFFNSDGTLLKEASGGNLKGSFSYGFSGDGQFLILGREGAVKQNVVIKKNIMGLRNFLNSNHLMSFSDGELGIRDLVVIDDLN